MSEQNFVPVRQVMIFSGTDKTFDLPVGFTGKYAKFSRLKLHGELKCLEKMTIHPIIVKIFQSGRQWWTD